MRTIQLHVALQALLVVGCFGDRFNDKPIDRLRRGDNKIRTDKDYYVKPGTSAAKILRARGYIAREYRFTTSEGYVLSIVRGTNPLINRGKHGLSHKDPILFVHGSISSGPIWVLNSKGARAQDFTDINVNKLTLDELNKLIGYYDSARSLPMLAMNFGYEIWIVNRRGFSQSDDRAGHLNRTWHELITAIPASFLNGNGLSLFQSDAQQARPKIGPNVWIDRLQKASNLEKRPDAVSDFWLDLFNHIHPIIDLPSALLDFGNLRRKIMHTFDRDYWDFSFDEQARNDFPEMIDFVLRKTGHKKLIVFTHSAATPMAMMALTIRPNLADKISRMINLGSAVNTGTKSDRFVLLRKLDPLIKPYIGPIPFAFMVPQIQSLTQNACANEFLKRGICESLLDAFFGNGHGQQPVTQFIMSDVLQATSSREIQHIFQMALTGIPHMYNFSTHEENLKMYGEKEPPMYDFSRIKLRNMVFQVGEDDAISSPDMLKITVAQLSVPYKLIIINETGIHYNHGGAFLHDQNTRLTNLPMLMELERPASDLDIAPEESTIKDRKTTPEGGEDED